MHKLSIDLLEKLSDLLQTGISAPKQKITIFRGDKKGGYEDIPFDLPEITRITIDRRWNMSADELEVEISNTNGYYSPEYSNKKVFNGVSDLPLSGYKNVIQAFNLITCDLGYADELIRVFTGQIQDMEVTEKSVVLKFNALNAYRKLLKPIDPIDSRKLVYENEKAFNIIKDLCKRAGIIMLVYDNESIPINKDDNQEGSGEANQDTENNKSDTVNKNDKNEDNDKENKSNEEQTIENDFTIKDKIEFPLGTNYSDAIKKILEIMNHRIVGGRYGDLEIIKNELYTQRDFHNWEFNDYINMTEGVYQVDTSIIRNRVIIMSKESWVAFEDKYLIEYCNSEIISSGLEAPWAETIEQKWAVADNYFLSMRRKLRRFSVAVIGNPAMDVGDLVRLRMLTSTANDKYMITAIQSDFSSKGYIDQVDLEYIGVLEGHLCEQAEGNYDVPPSEDSEQNLEEATPVVMTLRDRIVDEAKSYLGIYYEWGGTYPNSYGLDCSHFTWRVLQKFGLMPNYMVSWEQKNWAIPISRKELKPGDLCFYTYGANRVQHVVMYIGNSQMIGANGGNGNTKTIQTARRKNAKVKIANIGNPSYCGRPPGLE